MLQLMGMILVALIVGYAGFGLNRDSIPGGMLGSCIAGMAGAWLGVLLLGSWGPDFLGLHLVPPFFGAVGFMCILGILARMTQNPA